MSTSNTHTLPNVDSIVSLSHGPTQRILEGARGNATLAAVLEGIDALSEAEASIDNLRALVDSWASSLSSQMTEVEDVLLDGATTGRVADAMKKIGKLQAEGQARDAAMQAVPRLAGRLATSRNNAVRDSADTILAQLNDQAQQAMSDLAKHRETLSRVSTPQEAVRAGQGEAWNHAEEARDKVVEVRAAQRLIVRYLVPDVHEWLKNDEWIAPGRVEGLISPGGWSHACTEEVSR